MGTPGSRRTWGSKGATSRPDFGSMYHKQTPFFQIYFFVPTQIFEPSASTEPSSDIVRGSLPSAYLC